ncbi:MAG: toll/interleukin-1 receptor domain-containing protein [Acidobacteriota bacterium]
MKLIFVSYSREDAGWADRVEEMFAPLLGDDGEIELFIDRTDIAPGDDWPDALDAAIERAHVGIVLVTPRALATEFVMKREVGRFLARGIRVLALYIEDCLFEATPLERIQFSNDPKYPLIAQDRAAQSTALKNLVTQTLAVLGQPIGFPAALRQKAPGGVEIEIDRLPQGVGAFVGRAEELVRLDELWNDPQVQIASLVAWGGVGKTALTQAWLARMAQDGYRGAKRVYAWSFYSQGTKNRIASADDFLLKALAWFGESDPTSLSQSERPKRLAALILVEPTLLILDGLEPLQHGPGPQLGKLKEHGLSVFLRALASAPVADKALATHLCLLTTRVPVADLDDRQTTSFWRIDLQHLGETDGVKLLRALGVEGHEHDMKAAWKHARGHALTLKLVGQYAVDVFDGDVSRSEAIELFDPEAPDGQQATKVLDAYDAWLGDTPERAIVRLMGLFDRPADAGCVAALRAGPVIEALTDALVDLPASSWKRALMRLRRIGLLFGGTDVELDAHPLVREYAANRLDDDAACAGHLRLYEHLTSTTEPHQPDTVEGLMPLYQAVVHGCRAGRVQEVFDTVYRERIRRGDEGYSTKQLGLFGLELVAVSSFFEETFTRPHSSLPAFSQAWLLNAAGFRLRALGRLSEVEMPFRESLAMREDQGELRDAAVSAGNLSVLNITLGMLTQAAIDAKRAAVLADRSGSALWRMATNTILADVCHQSGDLSSALSVFTVAEAIQASRDPAYPRLYSLWGYRYCDLLLAPGDALSARAVMRRGQYMLNWAIDKRMSLLSRSVSHLSLGRALTILGHGGDPGAAQPAHTHLAEAVDYLRAAGQDHELPRGLLARATFSRLVDRNAAAADVDLQEVEDLAARCGMRLFACDAHLERARLLRDLSTDDDAREQARPHVEMAKKLIAETGYHRRDRELENLERWLSGEAVPKAILGAWG